MNPFEASKHLDSVDRRVRRRFQGGILPVYVHEKRVT